LFFVHTPDNSPDFYGGYEPMILTPVVPLFLLGLGYMCLHWRHPGMRLLILWLAGMVLGLGLIRIGAWTARYVAVFPVIALLIALALYYVIGLLVAERYRFRVAVALALMIGVGQVIYYFGPHLEVFNQQIRYYRDYVDAYHRATAYPPDTAVIFISDDHVHEPYIDILKDLWERDMPVMHYYYLDFTYRVLRDLSHHVNYVFFVQRDDAMTPALLRLEFHLEGPYFSPYDDVPADKQYALYYAPMMYRR